MRVAEMRGRERQYEGDGRESAGTREWEREKDERRRMFENERREGHKEREKYER